MLRKGSTMETELVLEEKGGYEKSDEAPQMNVLMSCDR